MPFIIFPLEVSFNPDAWEQIGIVMFYIAIIAIVIAGLSLFISLIQGILKRDYTKTLKIGLIALLTSGLSLLLTSVFCGWYR